MTDRFKLSGGYTTTPLGGEPSFAQNIDAVIDEVVDLARKKADTITLDVDTPVAISFGGLTETNIIILKSTSGVKVVARLTSAAGALAPVPFDTFIILMSMDEPYTAIDLTRPAGVETDVLVFLGEES